MNINSEGISPSRVFLPPNQSYLKLLDFFVTQFPHILASEWEQRFSDELILDVEGTPLSANDPYLPNTHLQYTGGWSANHLFHLKSRSFFKMSTFWWLINPISCRSHPVVCTCIKLY